jgi:hypothetical protein
MNHSTIAMRLRVVAAVLTLSVLALSAGAINAEAVPRCGVVTAAGHTWAVIASGVPCSTASRVVRGFAARTAALRVGGKATVKSPLAGFQCIVANLGKPGGACSTAAGAPRTVLWVAAS